MAYDNESKSYVNDQESTQYHCDSMYDKILKPEIKAYNKEYSFSRGDTICPSSMHGDKRNVQSGA